MKLIYLRWHWSALAESWLESSAIPIFMSAKEKMFKNMSLDDDLESLLSSVRHLEAKTKKSLMRMKDETGLKPVGLRNESRTAITNCFQFLNNIHLNPVLKQCI